MTRLYTARRYALPMGGMRSLATADVVGYLASRAADGYDHEGARGLAGTPALSILPHAATEDPAGIVATISGLGFGSRFARSREASRISDTS